MDVTAWKCETCGYFAERLLPKCKQGGHRFTQMKVKKRWFMCGHCKKRETVLNKRLPPNACANCSHNCWQAAAMHRDPLAGKTAAEFLPRGHEHGRFLGSDANTKSSV